MNRTAVAAIAAAAVIGTVAGSATALLADRDLPTSPTTASDRSGGATESPADASEPLWATATTIHDGDRLVDVEGMGAMASVERLPQGGWLATTATGEQEPSFGVYRVDEDGVADPLTFTLGTGDVSADGTRYVGLDLNDGVYVVREVATGKELRRIRRGTRPDSRPGSAAAFAGDKAVVTEWYEAGHDRPYLVETSPGQTAEVADGLTGWNVSAAGELLAGNARNPDPKAESLACASTGGYAAAPDHRLRNCDLAFYGRARFSPSGDRAVAVPAMTDGFGPALFVVVDSRTGEPVREIEAPVWSLEAALLDDDTLLVRGAINGEGNGTVVSTCDLDGACTEIGRAEGPGVLGTVD